MPARLVLVCVLAACHHFELQADLVDCPEYGLACAPGFMCDAVHHICVTPEQAISCADTPEGAACTTRALTGTCLGGVCLAAVCGDHVVEPGEACDDGNLLGGDGCNGLCSSTERCGNGVVDATLGEACDDGNLIGGDGCDSICGMEAVQWQLDGIAPFRGSAGTGAFDVAHERLIHVADGTTWTWTGTEWKLLAADGPPIRQWSWYQVVYDSTRGTSIFIGASTTGTVDHVWELADRTWTRLATGTGAPTLSAPVHAAYDEAAERIVVTGNVVGTSSVFQAWAFDVASSSWAKRTDPAVGYVQDHQLAYDGTRDRLVINAQSPTGGWVMEWTGTGWTIATDAQRTSAALMYDPVAGGVIAIGGSASNDVARWTGSAWTTLAGQALPVARSSAEAIYDTMRARRVVFGGYDLGDYHDVIEWTGSAWTGSLEGPTPYVDAPMYAYDYAAGVLVQYGGRKNSFVFDTDAWMWDRTTWRKAPTAATPAIDESGIAFDPVRGGVIISGPGSGTWVLRNSSWTQIEPAGQFASAMAYDPVRGGVLSVGNNQTRLLRSASTSWEVIGGAPNTPATSLACDPRIGMVLSNSGLATVFQLVGTMWMPTLSPGQQYRVATEHKRGSIVFTNFGGATGGLFERIGGQWLEHPPLPYPVSGVPVYAPDTGELFVIGTLGTARVILRRAYVGSQLAQDCTAGDTDGDALAMCDDPDCWWACAPRCPPYATCP